MQSECAGLYCHLWSVRLYPIFPLYPIKSYDFSEKKKIFEHKMCILIFLRCLSEIFRILRKIKPDMSDDQQDKLFWLIYLFIPSQLYVFRAMSSPIVRSTSLLFTASDFVHRRCCWLVSWMRWNSIPSHPWHQPAAISMNNIRCYKDSEVLLMMGEDIARNT